MVSLLCTTNTIFLVILLVAKSFATGAAISSDPDACVPSIHLRSERTLIDASFTTIAGIDSKIGDYNEDPILASLAVLQIPSKISYDPQGNLHFIDHLRVRKVDKDTQIMTTVAGSRETSFNGDGILAIYAGFRPSGFTIDVFGDMFISDEENSRIRKVSSSSGLITTVAGNDTSGYNGDNILASKAIIYNPMAITSDSLGNLYFVDKDNYRVRKITRSTGIITTVAGSGQNGISSPNMKSMMATSVKISPLHIIVDSNGLLYTIDVFSSLLLQVSLSTGIILSADSFILAGAVFLDTLANLYYTDLNEKLILKKSLTTGVVTTVATNVHSEGIYVDTTGNIIVSLTKQNTIIKVVPNANIASFPTQRPTARPTVRVTSPPSTQYDFGFVPIAGIKDETGGYTTDLVLATLAKLNSPEDVTFDGQGNMHIADTANSRVRKVDKLNNIISTVAGSGVSGFSGDGMLAPSAQLSLPKRITFDAFGNLYILDALRVRRVTIADGIITTVAGNGTSTYNTGNVLAASASIGRPNDIACDGIGNLYISDVWNSVVWKVDKSTGIMNVIFGDRKRGALVMGSYLPSYIMAMTVDAAGDLYLTDRFLKRVLKVKISTGVVTFYTPRFTQGTSCFLDKSGDLYYADSSLGQIRKVTVSTGVVTVVAVNQYFTGGICADADGNIYVAGTERNAVFKVTLSATPEVVQLITEPPTSSPTFTPTAVPTDSKIGVIAVVAGIDVGIKPATHNGDGILATAATLEFPNGVAIDGQGNLYINEFYRIRKVDKTTGIISTIAGGDRETTVQGDNILATTAFVRPYEIMFDPFGDMVFYDYFRGIRKITTSTGILKTIIGNGRNGISNDYNGENLPGLTTSVGIVTGIVSDAEGNLFYLDRGNSRIRKYTRSTGIVKTVAGNGKYVFYADPSKQPEVNNAVALTTYIYPQCLAIDTSGDLYFVLDASRVPKGFVKLTMSTGIMTIITTDVPVIQVFVDEANNIYYSSSSSSSSEVKVRKISASNGLTTIVANGIYRYTSEPTFYVDNLGDIYFSDSARNVVSKVTSSGGSSASPTRQPTPMSATAPPTRPPVETAPPTRPPAETAPPTRPPVETAPPTRPPAETAPPTRPPVETTPPTRPPAETAPPTPSRVETAPPTRPPAETAPPTPSRVETARPTRPPSIRTSRPSSGARIPVTSVVVAGVVRKFDGIGYNGDGILATTAYLSGPSCVTFDSQGNMHIADSSNKRVRKVDKITGIISTVAGTGIYSGASTTPFLKNILATQADIWYPYGILFDVFGDMYIANAQRIHKVTTSTGIINTVVGNGKGLYNGENMLGTNTSLNDPTGFTSDSQGNIYFSSFNNRIQKLTKSTGLVNTVAGNGKYGGYDYRVGNNVKALDVSITARTLAFDSSGDLYFNGEYEDGFIKLTMSTGILTTIIANNNLVYLFIDGFNNIYYSTLYESRGDSIYEYELYKYTASTGVSSLLANNLNASRGFHVDASGYIYMPGNYIVLKVAPNDNADGTPTPQPTQLTAPPTPSRTETAPPSRPPAETAPPTPSRVETAPPTRPPAETAPPTPSRTETAPPTRPPAETAPPTPSRTETAPPTRPPAETARPICSPTKTTRPIRKPTYCPTKPSVRRPIRRTVRPSRRKPSRAPNVKPSRKYSTSA